MANSSSMKLNKKNNMTEYPYMMSNNKISSILDNIKSAAKPPKFTHEFLKKIGFSSTNDRAIIPLLKRLGFLTEDGTPTPFYDELRDATQHQFILADRIKALYQELFQINTNIHSASEAEVKGAISRVTGKDETTVGRYFNTFKTLVGLARFDGSGSTAPVELPQKSKLPPNEPANQEEQKFQKNIKSNPQFHYNIQIHLPATTDISVYNAIFKSLKENLLYE